MSHDDGLDELSAALVAAGVPNELFHDCIHMTLPEGQGMVEVKAWAGGERSVRFFRGNESLDLVTVPGEFECPSQEAAARLIQRLAQYGVKGTG